MKLSLFFLFLLFQATISSSFGKVYILNVHQPEEKTWRTIETHFLKNYESDNLVDTRHLRKNIIKCTPELKRHSINIVAGKDSINYCLDKSYLALSVGLGHIDVSNRYEKGTHLNLSGNSLALSLALSFSSSLSALNIFNLDFHLLPNFRNDEVDELESVQLSSYINGSYIYQKRVENSPLSTRLGLSVSSTPTVKDKSSSLVLSDVEAQKVDILTIGPDFGLKYTFDHRQGGQQFFKLDYVPLLYTDNSVVKDFNSYELKFNYAYQFNRFISLDFKFSFSEVSLQDEHSFQTKVTSLAVKFYPF